LNYFPNYLVSVHIFVLDQGKISHIFLAERLDFKSFFFHPQSLAGILWTLMSETVSLPTFKAKIQSTLFPHTYNRLFDFSSSRRVSIDHTRLRLGFPCLREYLFKINRCASPICECGLDSESVKHFFFVLPKVCRSALCPPNLCC
jgi:hypothetical protein